MSQFITLAFCLNRKGDCSLLIDTVVSLLSKKPVPVSLTRLDSEFQLSGTSEDMLEALTLMNQLKEFQIIPIRGIEDKGL